MVTCLARMERCDVMGVQTCWPEFWFPILLKPSRDKHQHRQTAGREADRQTSEAVWGGASQQSQSEAAVVGMRISQDKLENTSKIDKAALRWDGTGLFFLSLPPLPPPPPLSLSLARSDGIHVVGRQHALLAGTLHAAIHPALVNLVHVYDHVPVHEGHLVIVGGGVVVNGSVPFLRMRASVRRLIEHLLPLSWPIDMFLLLYRRLKRFYPTTGRRGSSSLAHWFRSRITVVVLGTGRWLITSWKKSEWPSEFSIPLRLARDKNKKKNNI